MAIIIRRYRQTGPTSGSLTVVQLGATVVGWSGGMVDIQFDDAVPGMVATCDEFMGSRGYAFLLNAPPVETALTTRSPDGTLRAVTIANDGSLLVDGVPVGGASVAVAQASVAGIAQVINSSVDAKVTGASTFIQQGAGFDNGGVDNLTLRYINATPRFVKFDWSCVVREDPAGAGADGTVNVFLGVAGAAIAVAKSTTPVDAIHGGTAAGVFVRSCALNEVFELFANRNTGGGNGAITNVVFTATMM
jgi:hypothetical protein